LIKFIKAVEGHYPNLRALNLDGNPMETPPPEVVIKGLEAIKDYFRQIEAEGVDHLYEAKLLIVGEAGAGKTTLAKKINNPEYELRDDEETTKGIDVVEWRFPMENGRAFRVNIWDFGGQEIYHATHQFFLTRRSLYALVADTRKEDTDFYYWLNVVELLSDNSPLLIIKNEKQDRHREISERQLRGQFTNLKETLATNLATNRGLLKVLTEIKHHICSLPHVGTALPKTWVKVRETLENSPRNYISLDEYLDICKQNGFTQLKDKLQLSGYLHDLGVCLHFQGDPLLKRTVILNPEWGTDAVYEVLDNERVIRNLGRFNRADLANIWYEAKYAKMQDELLQLMINFKLCYRIPGSRDTYIAPQLLTENQPAYDWDETNNLVRRYTYEFMLKGIITRFIVAMHRYIADQECVWKSGVVLEKDQTKAEVIEYYGKREIRIRVAGSHKKELMTIVTYELDKIHDSYQRLKYSQLIPCNCVTCKDRQEPHFYPFKVLQRFAADRQDHIQCC
jgi:internalin A